MVISPIMSYYSAQNSAQVLKDYKSARGNFAEDKRDTSIFEMNTKREAQDISELISKNAIENTTERNKSTQNRTENSVEFGRFKSAAKEFKEGDYLTGTALGVLAVMYGPEDLREVGSAYRQIQGLLGKARFVREYDYKNAQHPFSFFRGSILHKSMNPFKADGKFREAKMWLLEKDKSLIDTKWGEKLLTKHNIKVENIETPIKEVAQKGKTVKTATAKVFISDNKFANLTARAMTRIPVLGVIADAIVEALDAKFDIENGENFFKAVTSATTNLLSSTITTAYIGALGSKLGPIGSLGTMVVAAHINNKIANAID